MTKTFHLHFVMGVAHPVVHPVSGKLTHTTIKTTAPNIFMQGVWYLVCGDDISHRIIIKTLPVLASIQDLW